MLLKSLTSITLATACLTALAAMPAHAAAASSPQQNVVQSQRYDRMLETNRAFRQARMRKECGPITDPQLRQSCLATFAQDEPYSGSSTPHHRTYHSGSGR